MRVATDHRELILSSAASLFAHKPFHEVLMDDVAEKAGIAKGTIYRHYANKDELFSALAFSYLEKLAAELDLAAGKTEPPLVRLREMVMNVVRGIQERSDFFQVMQRNECNLAKDKRGEFMQRRNHIRSCFVGVIDQAIERGELRAPFASKFAGDMIMGMIRSILRFNDPQPQPPEIADMVMLVITQGLGAKAGSRTVTDSLPADQNVKGLDHGTK